MNTPLTAITIYDPQGNVILNGSSQTFPVTDSCERNATIMGDDYIKLIFALPIKVDFSAFSYIEYAGSVASTTQRFFLKEDYFAPDKGGYYDYELNFVSFGNMLSKSICHRHIEVTDENNVVTEKWDEPEINVNANLEVMATLILQSIHQAALRLPTCVYSSMLTAMQLGTLQQNTSLLTYSFSGDTIYNVLTQVADMNDVEWYIDNDTATHPKLHIVKCERFDTIPLNDRFTRTGTHLLPTRSGGLLSCEYSQKWTDIPQFLIPYGSERNMKRKTAVANVAGAEMQVSFGKRLRLNRYDENNQLVDYNVLDEDGNTITIHAGEHGEIENTGVTTGIEVVEMFDDVYPRCHYEVTAVNVEGTPEYPKYVITAQAVDEATGTLLTGAQMVSAGIMPITLQEGQTLTIIFESGFLNGREFEVNNRSFKVSGQSAWNLILSIIAEGGDEDDSPMIPFGTFIPRVGDRFAMFGMEMPNGYIQNAKQELAQKAYDKMLEIESTRPEVKCTSDPNEFSSIYLVLGQRVAVQSDIFGASTYVSRVTSFSHSLTTPNNVSFKLASSRVVGRLAEVQQAIADRTNDIQGLEQRTINISRRGWRDASEMTTMLEALCAEMMLVGVEKYQFAFTSSITCVDVASGDYIKVFDHLHISAGTIEHTQKPYIDYANKGVWNVPQTDLNETRYGNGDTLNPSTAYYVYAVCSVPDPINNPNNEAEIILSATELTGTEYLLMGILSSEFDDTYDENNKTRQRVFNRSNGYTAIAGGTITTEQIQDPTRSLIIDFASNPPRIIAKNGAKIIGNIEFSLTEENIQQVLSRFGDIGGENLMPDSEEIIAYPAVSYPSTSIYLTPLGNGGQYKQLAAGTYVFSAKTARMYYHADKYETDYYADIPFTYYLRAWNYSNPSATIMSTESKTVNSPTEIEDIVFTLEQDAVVTLIVSTSNGAVPTADQSAVTKYEFIMTYAMLQRGTRSTTYQQYVEHLTNALKGTTEVDGGLIMTKVLMLKNESNAVTAGMSGLTGTLTNPEKVLLWGGGDYQAALTAASGGAQLPILITKNGIGSRIGCLKVVSATEVQVESSLGLIRIDTASGGIKILTGSGSNAKEKIVIVPTTIDGNYLPGISKPYSETLSSINGTGSTFTSDSFVLPATTSHSLTITINGSATMSSGGYEWQCALSIDLQVKTGSSWSTLKTLVNYDLGLVYSSPQTITVNYSQVHTDLGTTTREFRLHISTTPTASVSFTTLKITGSYVPTYEPKTVIGTDGILSAYSKDNYFYVMNDGTKQILYLKGLRGVASSSVIANSGEVCASDSGFTTEFAELLQEVAYFGAATALGATGTITYQGNQYNTIAEVLAVFLSKYKFLLTK